MTTNNDSISSLTSESAPLPLTLAPPYARPQHPLPPTSAHTSHTLPPSSARLSRLHPAGCLQVAVGRSLPSAPPLPRTEVSLRDSLACSTAAAAAALPNIVCTTPPPLLLLLALFLSVRPSVHPSLSPSLLPACCSAPPRPSPVSQLGRSSSLPAPHPHVVALARRQQPPLTTAQKRQSPPPPPLPSPTQPVVAVVRRVSGLLLRGRSRAGCAA